MSDGGIVRSVLVFFCLTGFCVIAQASDGGIEQYVRDGEKALAESRYADAEKAYENVRRLAPDSAEVQARLGLIYFQEGKFEQAVPVLRRSLKLKSGLPNVDVLLAMSLSELGHYTEALPGLEKGFKRSTDAALKRMSGLQLQRAYTGTATRRQGG